MLTLLTTLFIGGVLMTLGSFYGLLDAVGFLSPRNYHVDDVIAYATLLTISLMLTITSAYGLRYLLRR